jgi:hypothetical protein
MNILKIIQHMFVVDRKFVYSPQAIIPFSKLWHNLLCYRSILSACFLWLQCGHSHIPHNYYCNCKPLEWWGSSCWSLPYAVTRCCISNADMRKIKGFFQGLIYPKDLWLTKSTDLIVTVRPVGRTRFTQSTTSRNQLAWECTHSCGHVTVCISYVKHLN